MGNGTNYSLDSDDTFGPIVDVAGELGTADGASHPWTNFSRYPQSSFLRGREVDSYMGKHLSAFQSFPDPPEYPWRIKR